MNNEYVSHYSLTFSWHAVRAKWVLRSEMGHFVLRPPAFLIGFSVKGISVVKSIHEHQPCFYVINFNYIDIKMNKKKVD